MSAPTSKLDMLLAAVDSGLRQAIREYEAAAHHSPNERLESMEKLCTAISGSRSSIRLLQIMLAHVGKRGR